MKTKNLYTAIIISLAVVFAISLKASSALDMSIAGNPPVSDIMATEFDFEEEAYIDDIPFDTECISKNCIFEKALQVDFEMEDESFIDDIPFKTNKVVKQSKAKNAFDEEFRDFNRDCGLLSSADEAEIHKWGTMESILREARKALSQQTDSDNNPS